MILVTEREFPDEVTPTTAHEVGEALARAWSGAKRESILVLLAQSALETGRWRAIHCWNLGNIKHFEGDARCFTYFPTTEVVNGIVKHYAPPSPVCCFRAYASLDDGAADYLALLQRRFSAGWAAVIAGDPREFVRRLKAAGYFTAPEKTYEDSVAGLFHEFSSLQFKLEPLESLESVEIGSTIQVRAVYVHAADAKPVQEHDDHGTGD